MAHEQHEATSTSLKLKSPRRHLAGGDERATQQKQAPASTMKALYRQGNAQVGEVM